MINLIFLFISSCKIYCEDYWESRRNTQGS